jgi:hypothetical protein
MAPGAAVAGQISGEGRRGMVGQRHLGHEGGAADRFEGKRGQETHRTGFSTAAGIDRCGSSVRSHRGGRDRSRRKVKVEVNGRWRGDEATSHAFKWWVRMTGGPSPISDFSQDFQTPKF